MELPKIVKLQTVSQAALQSHRTTDRGSRKREAGARALHYDDDYNDYGQREIRERRRQET